MLKLKSSLVTFFLMVILGILPMTLRADHIGDEEHKLNPAFEGMYAITIKCERPSPNCTHDQLAAWDRLVIVDSRLPVGTWLTFASVVHGEIKDRYFNSKVGPGGDSLVAVPRFGTGAVVRFAYIDIHFNHQTGNLDGTIIAQDSLLKYVIKGKPLPSVHTLAKRPPPLDLTAEQIEGIYHGNLGKYAGRLVVKSLPNGHAVGNFQTFEELAPGQPLLELDFHSGEWERQIGVLILSMQLRNFAGQGILALSVRGHERGKLALTGFQAAGFKTNDVNFVREVTND